MAVVPEGETLAEAVRCHHNAAAAGEHSRLAAYTYLANMMSCFMGFGCGHQPLAFPGRTEALDLAGIDAADLPRYIPNAFRALTDLKQLLDLKF